MDEPSLPTEEEAALLRRARRGDQQAFERLYHLHARALHTLAWRLTGDSAMAEDIVQEAFLRMFRFLSGLRDGTPVRPWLKRVVANLAIDRLRQRRKTLGEDEVELAATDAAPALGAEASGLLRRLSPLARTLVWLHEMEGWSHEQLAERFGRSPSWSKSIISRALQRLREDLDHPAEPPR